MRRRTEQTLVGLVVIVGILLAIIGCQPQREPSAGVEPSQTVFTPAEPTPTSVAPTASATPLPTVVPAPSETVTPPERALPRGEPAQVVVTAADGTVLVDTSLVPTYLQPNLELVPVFGTAGWYAEADWSRSKPGFPGPSILVGHISNLTGAPDVFGRLPEVRPGDVVLVRYDSGDEVSFLVSRSEPVNKDDAVDVPDENGVSGTQIAKDIWMPEGDQPVLRIVTCDPSTDFVGSHYLGNWVVFGEII